MNTTKQITRPTSITTNIFDEVQLLNAKIQTYVNVKNIKGTSFVGVQNYVNTQGEVSNQTFIVGISYANLLNNDLQTLSNFDINSIISKYPNDRLTVLKAYNELLESLVKRTSDEQTKEQLRAKGDATILRSDAQNDAYVTIANGLRLKDDCLYVYGLRVRKEIIVSIEYPTVNSALKTIIKNEIKRTAKLRGDKFRSFKLGSKETLKLKGSSITPMK